MHCSSSIPFYPLYVYVVHGCGRYAGLTSCLVHLTQIVRTQALFDSLLSNATDSKRRGKKWGWLARRPKRKLLEFTKISSYILNYVSQKCIIIVERLVHCSKPLQRPGRARLNKS